MRAWGLHRDEGRTGDDRGLTTAKFRSSTCLNITLHLALPSFFPLAFGARHGGSHVPRGLGVELYGNSLEG